MLLLLCHVERSRDISNQPSVGAVVRDSSTSLGMTKEGAADPEIGAAIRSAASSLLHGKGIVASGQRQWGLKAIGSRDLNPLVACTGVSDGLDYAHVTDPVFEGRVGSLSAT